MLTTITILWQIIVPVSSGEPHIDIVALWLLPLLLLAASIPAYINRPRVYVFHCWCPPSPYCCIFIPIWCWLLCHQYFRVLVAEFLLQVAVVVAVDDQFRIIVIALVDVTSSDSLWSSVVVTSMLSLSWARKKHMGKPPINIRSMFIVASFILQSSRSTGSPRNYQLLCISSLTQPIHTSDCCTC